jgi:flagellar assembly protein FliH
MNKLASDRHARGAAAFDGGGLSAFDPAGVGGVELLEFRSLAGESDGEGPPDVGAVVQGDAYDSAAPAVPAAEAAALVEAQREAARVEGFQRGEREGQSRARAAIEAEMQVAVQAGIARQREQVVKAVEEFRSAREEYFGGVEAEVVKLALAIAARVLHRETQIDPLLLEGAVRVALEKMAERASVVLRASPPDIDAWERVFHGMDVEDRPKVRGDAALARGECVLETRMGTVELGVKAQLEEIERGFFDLLSHRPARGGNGPERGAAGPGK